MTDLAENDLLTIRDGRDVSFTDLVSIDQMSLADIGLVLDVARGFRAHGTYKFAFNKGCSMVNAFFEASTRTMSSFDLSAKQLSMDTSNVGSASSSTKKGETYLDTAETLDAYNLKVIVIRAKESGVPEMLARHVNAAIINAGDGWQTALQRVKLRPATRQVPVIAFGSHVQADVLRAARAAGADHAWPRSKLMGDLPRIIAEAVQPPVPPQNRKQRRSNKKRR